MLLVPPGSWGCRRNQPACTSLGSSMHVGVDDTSTAGQMVVPSPNVAVTVPMGVSSVDVELGVSSMGVDMGVSSMGVEMCVVGSRMQVWVYPSVSV